MAKIPLTVYLDEEVMAALDGRATALGKTRSACAAQMLGRSIAGGLSEFDELLIDQLTKMRARVEVLTEQGGNVDQARKRSTMLAERFAAEARVRLDR